MKNLSILLAAAILAVNVSAQSVRVGEAGMRPASQSVLKGMKAVQTSAKAGYKAGYTSRKSGKEGVATVTLKVVGDPWGDGSGFNLLIDADATLYQGYYNNEYPYWNGIYDDCEYKIPENASLPNLSVVLNGEASVDVPEGALDFIVCNPTAEIVFATRWADSKTMAIADNFEFKAGFEYIFTIETQDLVIYAPEHDAKLSGIVLPAASPDLTDEEEVTVTLVNSGKQSFSSVQLSYSVDGGSAVTETCTATLAPGAETTYTFAAKADFSGVDAHTVTATVVYDMDMNSMNNTVTGTVESPASDILFARVLAPVSSCEIGDATLGAKITNIGLTAVSEFTLSYQVGNSTPVVQAFTQTIAPNDTVTVYFDQAPNLSAYGVYKISLTASTPAAELDTENNKAEVTVSHLAPVTELPVAYNFENSDDVAQWFVGEGDSLGLSNGWELDEWHDLGVCIYNVGSDMPLLSRCFTLEPGSYRFIYNYAAGFSFSGITNLSDFYVTCGKAGTDPRTWEPVKEHLDVYTPTSEGIVTDEIAVEITETDDYVFAFFLGERQFNLMLYGAAVAKSGPDMAFGKVITPITSCSTGSEEVLGAEVYNKGSETASEFTLTYKIGGKPAVTQTFTQTVAVGETVTVYFTQPADLSAVGEHSITFTVSAAGETITDNNSMQAVVKHTEIVTEWPFESDFSNAADTTGWYNGEGDPGTYGGWHVTPGTNCYFGLATTMPLLSPCVTLQPGVYRFNYHYTTGIELFGTIYTSDFYVAYGKSGTDPKTWEPAKEYDDEYVPKPAVEDGFNVTITEAGEYVFGFFITQSDGDLSVYKTSLSDNVGIEDENLLSEPKLTLYPNPAEDVLNIELCNNTINAVTVYNVSGKKVYATSNINSPQFKVSTAAFNSGVYFIQVQTPHGMVNAKFAVK